MLMNLMVEKDQTSPKKKQNNVEAILTSEVISATQSPLRRSSRYSLPFPNVLSLIALVPKHIALLAPGAEVPGSLAPRVLFC